MKSPLAHNLYVRYFLYHSEQLKQEFFHDRQVFGTDPMWNFALVFNISEKVVGCFFMAKFGQISLNLPFRLKIWGVGF